MFCKAGHLLHNADLEWEWESDLIFWQWRWWCFLWHCGMPLCSQVLQKLTPLKNFKLSFMKVWRCSRFFHLVSTCGLKFAPVKIFHQGVCSFSLPPPVWAQGSPAGRQSDKRSLAEPLLQTAPATTESIIYKYWDYDEHKIAGNKTLIIWDYHSF